MPAAKTWTYADNLFYDALLTAINGANDIIEIATFLFRTGYEGDTRSDAILDALIAAKLRGVRVLVALDYSRFEPSVASENFETGQALAAAGCEVRMGPLNQTLHAKVAIIDLTHVFIGSHNITRGALTFNKEITVYSRTRAMRERVGVRECLHP